jgi:hypothetical protein
MNTTIVQHSNNVQSSTLKHIFLGFLSFLAVSITPVFGNNKAILPPPTVSITVPTNNATYVAPAFIAITATAASVGSTIKQVDFYNGTTLLKSDTRAPYSTEWGNVAVGTYKLTAKATDATGATTTSAIITVVVKANTAPTVSITSPANNANFTSPALVSITANAADVDGNLSHVEFYQGSRLIGIDNTAPYSVDWRNVQAGTYQLTAKAVDRGRASATSSVVNIVVTQGANVPPTVSIVFPRDSTTFWAPATIALAARALDIDGRVTRVQFFNGTTLLGTDSTAPHTFNWANVAAGTYSITAKATDNSGAVTTSSAVRVYVKTNTPPRVAITAPANNATFTTPTDITITATATDADAGGAVAGVAFYRDTVLIGVDRSAPYSTTWRNPAAGTYKLTAKALDNGGASSTSAAVTVVVKQGAICADNYEPNNNSNQPRPIRLGTAINATIGNRGDEDYFLFTTTTAAPKVKVTLSNLPANYDVKLYAMQGRNLTQVGSSSNTGTINDVITYNTATTGGVYIVRVFGVDGASSAAQCYSLLAQSSNVNFLMAEPIELGVQNLVISNRGSNENTELGLTAFPNPANDQVNVVVAAIASGDYTLNIMDIVGKIHQTQQVNLAEGENIFSLNLANYNKGLYFISIQNKEKSVMTKLVVK